MQLAIALAQRSTMSTTLKILLSFCLLFSVQLLMAQETVSGKLKDASAGAPLPFATIKIANTNYGTTSDENGEFSFSIPKSSKITDSSLVEISFVGYQKLTLTLEELKKKKNIKLSQNLQQLETFEVTAEISEEAEAVQSTQMSAVKLDMREIKYLPAIGGEVDIIKAAQLLPGISAGFEGSTGLYVRGGNADQNLVIYDDAPLYEFGHLFGFFSIFNNDVVEDITILKGAFPANYGGRLSSVIDVESKSEFTDTLKGQGGIGLLSSRLTLQAPFAKGKGSVLVSGRRTYIDRVARIVDEDIPYYFYDANGKVGYQINDKNTLWYSVYFGEDILSVAEEGGDQDAFNSNFGYDKFNFTQSVKWNRIYSAKLSSDISLVNTLFSYNINGRFDENSLKVSSNVLDAGLKPKFTYRRNKYHTIEYGSDIIFRRFTPNIINTTGEISAFLESNAGPEINNLEYAAYGVSKQKFFGGLLAVDYGLRLSGSLADGKNYLGFEPRLASRYTINENNTVKLSYSRMRQYLHRVSSASVVLPTDLWYPVTNSVRPMTADQVAVGYDHLFPKVKTTFTVEGYYKYMQDVIEYKEGANLILNNDFEEELLQGRGDAYGTEFLLKKRRGNFTGWIGYTLSWSTRLFDELNNGNRFWARYDRRHDFSSTFSYDLTKRFTVSAIWVYSSGPRFTAQTGQYIVPNPTLTGIDIVPIYSERNAISLSPSHRLDLNLVYKPNKKFNGRWQGAWNVGAYNVYNQAAPFQVQIEPTQTGYKYVQPGLFGFLPYFSYNFSF